MKTRFVFFVAVIFLMGNLFSEVKESRQSNGDPYFYFVPDSPSGEDSSGGGSGSGSGGGPESSGESSSGNGESGGGESGEGAESGGDSGSSESGNSSSNEGNGKSGDESISALEAAAKEAENALTEVTKKYIEKQSEVESLVKAAQTDASLTDKVTAEKESLHDLYIEVSKKADEVSTIYNVLGNRYAQYECTGDPVRVSTGEFVISYADYAAQDFLDVFSVKRNLDHSNYIESFGKNWICSLDSRIVRCCFKSYSEEIQNIKDAIEALEELVAICDEYIEKYENFPSDELEEYKTENTNAIEELKRSLASLENLNSNYNYYLEKNKYVKYGRYANAKSFYGYEDIIKYLDENGSEYALEFKNDRWVPMGVPSSSSFCIYGLDSQGAKSATLQAPGGYVLERMDGSKKYFSSYGILIKEIDRCGNQTVYENVNGKISKVILKTGEVITVARDSLGLITSITGTVSGSASYAYNENRCLRYVRQNSNLTYNYEYDGNFDLSSIKRSDNTTLKIKYEIKNGKKLCSSVIDENGNPEYFSLNMSENTMLHKDFEGRTEQYKFDSDGSTIFVKDAFSNIISFDKNSDGTIKSVTTNGNRLSFAYNSRFLPVSTSDSYGYLSHVEYDNFGRIIKITDADGFTNTYAYDANGNVIRSYFCNNLCGSYQYYSNGLLKSFSENGMNVSLEYNKYGSITKKTEAASGSPAKIWQWTYDSNNRPIKFIEPSGTETSISYSALKEVWLIGKTKRIIKTFDVRNRLVGTEESDLVENITYKKVISYDGRSNITKVALDGEVFAEYKYTPSGKLKSYTIWNLTNGSDYKKQGVCTAYTYDSVGRITSEVKTVLSEKSNRTRFSLQDTSVTKSFSYSGNNSNIQVQERKGALLVRTMLYDKDGRLVKLTLPDGYTKQVVYSRSGRLQSIKDSNLNVFTYTYKTNGGATVSQKNCNGAIFYYDYAPTGLLLSVKDGSGTKNQYSYDYEGKLLRAETKTFKEYFSYDIQGRNTSYCVKNAGGKVDYEYSVVYDDSNRTISYKNGDAVLKIHKYDGWQRIIETNSADGHYWYAYDVLGNCVKSRDSYGNETSYFYAPFGNVASVERSSILHSEYLYDVEGHLLEARDNKNLKMKNEFNKSGKLVSNTNKYGGAVSFEYDSNGTISSVNSYDTGSVRFQVASHTFMKTDDNDNVYSFETDLLGNIISEVNPQGKNASYTYDDYARIIRKKNFSGRIDTYEYDDKNNTVLIKYGNGEQAFIQRNALNLITKLQNDSSSYEYIYNSMGNLIAQKDLISDISVILEYDNLGRCVKKQGQNFNFFYEYDNCGRLQRIGDKNTNVWLAFEYDALSREISRKYSSGLMTEFVYDEYGRTASAVTKDNLGQVIFAQFILYDEKNKIEAVCDMDGNITSYQYDDDSRIVEVEYPFSQDWTDFYAKEAYDCGLFVNKTPQRISKKVLSDEKMQRLSLIIKNARCENYIRPNSVENIWYEKYTYNPTGSISSVENPLCTIFYEYDSLNRLVNKYADNTREHGISYKWNDDGCLEEALCAKNAVRFVYGAQNRPVYIEAYDFENGSSEASEYMYDALGRRVRERNSRAGERCFVYDGLSNSMLCNEALFQNGEVSSKYYSDINAVSGEKKYRLADSSSYSEYGMFKGTTAKELSSLAAEKSCAILGAMGTVFAILNTDAFSNSGTSCEFTISDYRNNIVLTASADYELSKTTCYDVWGNSISGEAHYSFYGSRVGICGLTYADIGARDYCPALKCFTSKDPSNMGMNFYVFCACDPINYYDNCGLYKSSYSNSQNAKYAGAVLQFTKFNKTEYLEGNMDRGMRIPQCFDCADVAACIDYQACLAANVPVVSSTTKAFIEPYNEGNYTSAKDQVSSETYNTEKGATQVKDGYDRDYLRHTEYSGTEKYATELEKKAAVESYLKDPNVITPGTCLVWKNSDAPSEKSPSSCGHVATVLSRQFDADGNVTGFIFIQGHSKGNGTELCFMSTSDMIAGDRIDEFYGAFSGIYENESPNPETPSAAAGDSSYTGGGEGSSCGV